MSRIINSLKMYHMFGNADTTVTLAFEVIQPWKLFFLHKLLLFGQYIVTHFTVSQEI
jgi:hypothetical protein